MRFFNTAGPCMAEWHYMLPAAERLPEAPELIAQGMYFVVHGPRQTGKTTTLQTLAEKLTNDGHYAALHFSCEAGKIAGDDYVAGQRAVLAAIRMAAESDLPHELHPPRPPDDGQGEAEDATHLLASALAAWARHCPRRLVLFFDEIDALRGSSLLSVLSQLRAQYARRPKHAPWSVVLCGLRDVRDYKEASGGDSDRLGTASPFNIKVDSIRLGDFTAAEVATLYAQHTAETGQPFTDEAVARAFALTAGQPWLVNALAREITTKMKIVSPTPITVEHVEAAKERLILARATHLDSLLARLSEERVRRIIEPIVDGAHPAAGAGYNDDTSYVRDLGLVATGLPLRIANPIYREVIVRALGAAFEDRTGVP